MELRPGSPKITAPGGEIDRKRHAEARALVKSLEFDPVSEPLKIAVMVRVRRVFNVEITSESFCCMLHIVTCWLAEGDAVNDRVSDTELEEMMSLPQHKNAAEHVERDAKGHLSFVYDADPDLAFYEPDFRPRMRVMRLCEGTAAADGEGGENYFYRTLCDGRTLVTWEVEKICKVGAQFDLRQYPVDVQGLELGLEMKTGIAETIFVPFPDEATFAHTPGGAVADVLTENVYLEDYSLLKNHEYSASLYHTKAAQSWHGEEYSGLTVTVWLRRKYMHDIINIAAAQCLTTSFVFSVWAIPKEEIANRLACDFALVLAAVAMKFVVNQTLPPVAYVTLLEQYVQLNFAFLATCTFFHAISEQMTELSLDCESGSCPDTVDMSIFSTLLLGGAGANVAFGLYMREMAKRQVRRVFDMNLSTGPEEHGEVRVMCEKGGVQARRFPSRDDESDNGKEHKVEDSAGAGRFTNPIASDDRG